MKFKKFLSEMAFVKDDLERLDIDISGSSHDISKYKDSSGTVYYVKSPNAYLYEYHSDSELHILVEYLAYEIYKMFGVRVPFVDLYIDSDKLMIASKETIGDHVRFESLPQYKDFVTGFAVDIFLANWDVAGSGAITGNLIFDDEGNVTRIDPGGSLTFRARGKKKGDSFSKDVGEINSMTDEEKSPVANAYNAHEELIEKSISNFVKMSWNRLKTTLDNFNDKNIISPIQEHMSDTTAKRILNNWESEYSEIINKLQSRYRFMEKIHSMLEGNDDNNI